MYISKIKISDIRCFENITLELSSDHGIYNWALILGDNGVGKTTLLRSIAMSFCGAGSISGLTDEIYGEWIRKGKRSGSIRVDIGSGSNTQGPYFIETYFERGYKGAGVQITQKTEPARFPWDKLFVCGYGATRKGGELTPMSPKYKVVDSIYSLFNYGTELNNPEVVLRRINLPKVLNWVEGVLMLPEGSLELNKTGIVANGPWGQSIPFLALGDGHHFTATWLLDFLGWALLHDETMFSKEISGVVLVDELEQHLHPIWQKNIVKLLRNQFPGIQFIATTHSALVATGTTSLKDDECTLVLLEQAESNHVTARDRLSPPRKQRADQILTSYLFGLTTSSDDVIVDKIERYSQLASKTRNEKENREFLSLRSDLNNLLGTEETELQRLIANNVHEALEQRLESISIDSKALDYEIKRQLRELFKTG